MCDACDQFRKKMREISIRDSPSPKCAELGQFTLLFSRQRLRNVQRLLTYKVIVLVAFIVVFFSVFK